MGGGPSVFERMQQEAQSKVNAILAQQKERQDILDEEKRRAAQEEANKKASLDLTTALSKQKEFAGKAQGKGGTLLTAPLGVVDQQSQTGQKTLLGL